MGCLLSVMRSLLRGFKLFQRGQPAAPVSLVCRGKSISREELFAYTNGRFLADEEHQLARRYLNFNIDALCNLAAAAGGDSSRITSIEKLEGGFSKAFLMKKENGAEVIAKLPCRIAGPSFLTTACEVGALEYVRKHTSIPVPRIFSWSADDSNPVGAEYIIMEKAPGLQLYEQWGSMKEIQRMELIRNLTRLEAQLSAIRFPSYGGLYRRADVSHLQVQFQELDASIDPTDEFCMGPSCDRMFITEGAETADIATDFLRTPPAERFDQGPWNTLSGLGLAIAKRELSRLSCTQYSASTRAAFPRGSIQEQSRLLEYTMTLMPLLDTHPKLSGDQQYAQQPTLWHTDLHMGNIFVSPDDHSCITCLIDFQSIQVLPFFLQAQWPVFLKPADTSTYTRGFVQPELPADYEELEEPAKAAARYDWEQSKAAKAYEVASILEDGVAYNAMFLVPRVFKELFTRTGEVAEAGAVPLRECLIEIYQNWSSLGFAGSCPFSFTEEEIEVHNRQFKEYQEWNQVQQLVQECLSTDAEGWISPQLNFAEKVKQNKELRGMYMERMKGEISPERLGVLWPFPAS